MDHPQDGRGPRGAGRTEIAAAPRTETRSVWLPDEWAGYIAYGEDPGSLDWPVSQCDEELRRLRLEGFETVACTDATKELREYRGIAGTMRRYEAMRTGGDDFVVRRVTLVRRSVEPPDGADTAEILVDATLRLTRTESQPIERLAARAVFDALGKTRRAARAWTGPPTPGIDRAWLHIDADGPFHDLPRAAWTDQVAIAAHVDARNCVSLMALKPPGTPAARHERVMPFYDHEGRLRCPVCDAVKRIARRGSGRGCPIFCPRCD